MSDSVPSSGSAKARGPKGVPSPGSTKAGGADSSGFAAAVLTGQEKPLTAAALASAPPGMQKQMLGDKLFPAIRKYRPELADKITGMMLEKDNGELLALLGSERKLKSMIDETMRILKEPGKKVCEYERHIPSAGSAGVTHAAPSSPGFTQAAPGGPGSPEAVKRGSASATAAPSAAASSNKLYPKRRLVELCCGPSSLLGQPGPNTEGCEVIRITELEDILTEEGQRLAFEAVDFPHVMVWISLECKGGSPWNSFNWVKGDDNTRAKIAEHINKFYAMFPIADHVAEIVLRNGGIINLELPASCYYWKTGLMKRFVGLNIVKLKGCSYNLRAKFGPNAGMLISKPWAVASNSRFVTESMNKPCLGNHTRQA